MVPVPLVERMRAELFREVVIAYGLTESCGTVTVGDPHADPQTACRTVGRAIEGTEVIIGGPGGTALPPGASGEVLVRGYNVMRGYFEDPEATAAALDPAGWLHTGDVGTLDADGNLRITDRLKDMFVVGGFNAYPAEIEQVIARHEQVSEAAVVGVPDATARRGRLRLRRAPARRDADRGGDHRVLPRAAGELQGPALGADGRRAPPQRVGQGAQVRTPRPGGSRRIVRSGQDRHGGRRLLHGGEHPL